jgi:asparagine synthase (glutamine-hydrolysing)
MCGIAGVIDPATRDEAREGAVLRMCNAMIHRGPDDSGILSQAGGTIGMRRLAIFDPTNGHQPMTTLDGRYSIVFNGAIYNFHALKDELESGGWSFRTRCDTEVLLAALVRWGADALGRLRGMFAFAFWDAAEQTLLAARDPFGIKPFYFHLDGTRLTFASEVSALLSSGLVPGEIDPAAVAEYLAWLAVPAPRTIYRGIRSLGPGEALTLKGGQVSIRQAWSFSSIPTDTHVCASREELVRELRARLEDAIGAHVIADVPVGAFLSGGLDSAVVAGLMSRVGGNALKTFSIGFEEYSFSEADEAEASARHFGAVHHTTILTGGDVARDVDKIIAACDQPTGDGVNTYYASHAAEQGGVKVALSGLGGDELFGGYPSFGTVPSIAARLPAWRGIPAPLRSLVTATLARGGIRARKLSDFLTNARDTHEVAALQRRVFSEGSRRAMLAPALWDQVSGASPFHPKLEALRADLPGADPFHLVSAWELRTYMADVLLRDSDVMSMRHSIELRVPFIDRPLIEWLWRQPSRFINDRRQPKSVLVDATADLLPAGLLGRKKRGFTLPFPLWMRADLRPFLDDVFSEASIGKSGFFSAGPVQALWRAFLAGGEDREWSRIWSLAVLIAFVNRRSAAASAQAA